MIFCTRKIEFDAAHRVVGDRNKCKYLHGHRYAVEATFAAEELNSIGMVIDFWQIKEKLGKWIDKNWDHATILYLQDKELGGNIEVVTKQTIFYLDANPTCENMADYLLNDVCPKLFAKDGARCTKIRLYETPNCYAEAISIVL